MDELERLRACERRIREHQAAIRAERKLRRRLVETAKDAGASFRQIGRAAGRAPSTIATILGQALDDIDDVLR
jgi:IS30 family transposase